MHPSFREIQHGALEKPWPLRREWHTAALLLLGLGLFGLFFINDLFLLGLGIFPSSPKGVICDTTTQAREGSSPGIFFTSETFGDYSFLRTQKRTFRAFCEGEEEKTSFCGILHGIIFRSWGFKAKN